MNKTFAKMRLAQTGESCYAENGFEEESADVSVFDESDVCTLNGQVNAAINSWARNYACSGRGKVYRQIIRSARNVKSFFIEKNGCVFV